MPSSGALFLWLPFVVSCATVAPRELVDARSTYRRASAGPAATVAPGQLHKARAALDQAERAFQIQPEAATTSDLAHIAQRKALVADEMGRMEMAARDKARAIERQSEADGQQAQARAEGALTDPAKVAPLRDEDLGKLLTLSGDVLFASGESTLLPSAQRGLTQIADALRETNQHLTIEGHTDSRGGGGFNMQLSDRRAQAVRDFLVSRGIAAERCQVAGFGKTRPVADNRTAEGRADNRRVEIVIEARRTANR